MRPGALQTGRVHGALLAPLGQLRTRRRLYQLLESGVRLGLLGASLSLAQYLFDRGLRLDVLERALISGALLVVGAIAIWRLIVRPLRAAAADARLATLVDARHPELRDRITSAVEFTELGGGDPTSNSPQLVQAVIDEACRDAARVSFLDVLNHRRARQRAVELAAIGVCALALMFTTEARIWFLRNWGLAAVAYPQATYLIPDGFSEQGVRRAARGEPLDLVARTRGRMPRSVTLVWRTPGGRSGREIMTRVGSERWEASLGLLNEDVTFTLRGGDERTREFQVQAVERPRVVRTTVRVRPPEYTALPTVELDQQTLIDAPAGSTLEFDVELNKRVETAALVGPVGPVGQTELLEGRKLRATWADPAPGQYAFTLVDTDGLEDRRPVRFTIKVQPDEPPAVVLTVAGAGESITPRAVLPVRVEFRDAYGLTQVALQAQRNDEPPIPLPIPPLQPGQSELETEVTLKIFETLAPQPGQKVRLLAEAIDNRPGEPGRTQCPPVELRVLSVPDYLAELAERELELRREFERLISEQRGLSDALGRLLPNLTPEAPPPANPGQQLAGLVRRQQSHAERTLSLQESFADILAEMAINAVDRRGDERRIGEQIISPLGELGQRLMPAATDTLGVLRRLAEAAALAQAPNQQADILRAMQTVLANMLEWEGYREVVALLTDIIDEQTQLRTDTGQALGSELDAILGLDEAAPPEQKPPNP